MADLFRWFRNNDRLTGAARGVRSLLPPLLVGLAAFILGLHLFFPEPVLRAWLLAETARRLPPGVSFTVQRVELRLPLRLHLEGVALHSDLPELPPLALDRLTLAPTVATLFGTPGVRLAGNGASGRIAGRIDRDGRVDLELRDGRLELGGGERLPARLTGTVVRATLLGRLPPGPQSTLTATLQLDDLALHGGAAFGLGAPPLPLGRLQLELAGAGRGLQLQRLELSGGALQGEGRGELLLQPTLAASRIDLALQLRPAPGSDPALRSLLELLGPADAAGNWRLRLHGPLSSPALN